MSSASDESISSRTRSKHQKQKKSKKQKSVPVHAVRHCSIPSCTHVLTRPFILNRDQKYVCEEHQGGWICKGSCSRFLTFKTLDRNDGYCQRCFDQKCYARGGYYPLGESFSKTSNRFAFWRNQRIQPSLLQLTDDEEDEKMNQKTNEDEVGVEKDESEYKGLAYYMQQAENEEKADEKTLPLKEGGDDPIEADDDDDDDDNDNDSSETDDDDDRKSDEKKSDEQQQEAIEATKEEEEEKEEEEKKVESDDEDDIPIRHKRKRVIVDEDEDEYKDEYKEENEEEEEEKEERQYEKTEPRSIHDLIEEILEEDPPSSS